MQQILKITAAASLALALLACGAGANDKNPDLGKLKTKLEKLKGEKKGLDEQIRQLEDQLDKLDPEAAAMKAKLVTLQTIGTDSFSHFIDLQGKIEAENVVHVSPKGMGGVVKAIYVKTGSKVGKGQLLMKLDDALARQSLASAQQQVNTLKTRADQAQTVYERYQSLWKQNIGAEINVINAKADVDALKSQVAAAEAGVRMAQEQVNQSNVYAEIGGVVDAVNIKIGEFFSPQSAAMAGIRIVNTGTLKVVVNVPENYSSRIKEGTTLQLTLPESDNKIIVTKVNVVGKFIDPINRSFIVEGKVPADKDLRANQIASVQIRDYSMANVITVPVNVVQTDEKGKYVFVAEKNAEKLVVRKKMVDVGEVYNGLAEIKNGLSAGQQIITEGYQSTYEGQVVTTGKQK